jgi:tryptophan synthase alpha chain
MNALDGLFQRKKKNVLAVYFTAGFPKLNDTVSVIESLANSGADIIEIGMPFSDPLADGPVIQESSRVALENGMTIKLLFDQLKHLSLVPRPLSHAPCPAPLVLMGYLNPVLQFGMDKFLENCKACGISGVILPDLPIEVYESEYKTKFENAGVHFIFLVTPDTPEARVRKIVSLTYGFLYLVSSSSTTGGIKSFNEMQLKKLQKFSEYMLDVPVLTGFLTASEYSNGAVVGTAFIKCLEKSADKAFVSEFITEITGQTATPIK